MALCWLVAGHLLVLIDPRPLSFAPDLDQWLRATVPSIFVPPFSYMWIVLFAGFAVIAAQTKKRPLSTRNSLTFSLIIDINGALARPIAKLYVNRKNVEKGCHSHTHSAEICESARSV